MSINLQSSIALRTGRAMPILALGTLEVDNIEQEVERALKLGYPMIDASGNYGTHSSIAEGIAASGLNRSQFYIVTKVKNNEHGYGAMERDLKELRMDYVDLALIQWPPTHGAGVKLWHDLIRAKQDGLIKDIGVSNYNERQIEDLIENTGEVPVVNQIEWSPFAFAQEILDFSQENNIILQAYSPLTQANRLDDEELTEMAADYDKSPTQLLIRWNLQLGVVPFIKATSRYYQEENLDVFDFEITDADMKILCSMCEAYSAIR
jgi:diketogulonate reductase-like aldo/keto reductase